MLAAAMFLRKVEMVALGLIKKKYIYIWLSQLTLEPRPQLGMDGS